MQPAFDEPADDTLATGSSMQGDALGIDGQTVAGHGAVHSLDDVAAITEVAQGRLDIRCQCPIGRTDALGQTHAFECLGTT